MGEEPVKEEEDQEWIDDEEDQEWEESDSESEPIDGNEDDWQEGGEW